MEKIGIQDPGCKSSDPGSGINIPDPQRWLVISSLKSSHAQCVFLPDLYLLKKKATAAFITSYVTGLNKTNKIFRKLQQNEYKAKI
jgi:hypothetical protein